MKRTALVLTLILILSAVFAPAVFASGLSVVKVIPGDGETGKQPQNMAVKVTFSQNITDEDSLTRNQDQFSITDASGASHPFQLVCNPEKYPDELWLVLSEDLEADTEYTFTAKAGTSTASGQTLETDFVSTFKTRNTATDNTLSIVMMVVMMVLMVVSSMRSARRQESQNAMEASRELEQEAKNLSPYKIAKEKGISIEEATRIVEKERARLDKKRAKIDLERAKFEKAKAEEIAKAEAELLAAEEAARRANNYRVKHKQSMKDHGLPIPASIVKKNQKKRAEAQKAAEKAAKEAARAEAEKQNKSKNGGGKKKKKKK